MFPLSQIGGGLRLDVPDCWWRGHKNTNNLNESRMIQFDPEDQKWIFVCETNSHDECKMQCNAVLECADKGHHTCPELEDLLVQRVVREVKEEDDDDIVLFEKTDQSQWEKVDVTVDNPSGGRATQPIPWTGSEDEESTPKLAAEERELFKGRF